MIIYKSLDKATFHCYSNTPGSTGELLLYRKKCIFEGGRPLDKRSYHPKITKQFTRLIRLNKPNNWEPIPKTRPRKQLPHSKRSCGLGKVNGKCKLLSKPNEGRLGCSLWSTSRANPSRPFGRRVSFLAEGVKRDSEEPHLLKALSSGGGCTLKRKVRRPCWPGSKIGPNRRRLAWAVEPLTSRGGKWGGPVDQAPPLGQNAAGSPGRPRLRTFYVRNTHFPDMFEFHHCFQVSMCDWHRRVECSTSHIGEKKVGWERFRSLNVIGSYYRMSLRVKTWNHFKSYRYVLHLMPINL